METINENKKIIKWFKGYADVTISVVLGLYILFLSITSNLNLYSRIAIVFGGAYFLWLGYYRYKEGTKNGKHNTNN